MRRGARSWLSQSGQKVVSLRRDCLPVKRCSDFFLEHFSLFKGARRIIKRGCDERAQSVCVMWFCKVPVHTIINYFARPSNIGCDYWKSKRACFEHGRWKPFII